MFIKICGITNRADALAAVEAGADALGFVLHPRSPRCVAPETVAAIIDLLPAGVLPVAVVLPGDAVPVGIPWGALQVHHPRRPADLPPFAGRRFAALPAERWREFADAELIVDDSMGRGRQADPDQVSAVARPFILSGGLTPENVAGFVRELGPIGVDVSSGVEQSPGIKDRERMKRLIANARKAKFGM